MADLTLNKVISTLLADAYIASKVGFRVQGGHIKDTPDPTYPLITVARASMGTKERSSSVQSFRLLITAYSSLGYDQAWDLMERCRALLDCQRFQTTTNYFVCYFSGSPAEGADDDAEKAFHATALFSVEQL